MAALLTLAQAHLDHRPGYRLRAPSGCVIAGATPVGRLDAIPTGIRQAADLPTMAEADEPFNGRDMVDWRPSARFLRAYRHGDQWAIWFETGGWHPRRHAVGVRPGLVHGDMKPLLSAYFLAGNDEVLCLASRAFFAGASTEVELRPRSDTQ
ncbi:hypothetical protein [Sphingomonas sp.]|uniref:hypothetical protein n=1 Tax=Sphingomonas sp. TaxID=28214 RepID=UPI003CC5D793